MNERDYYIDKNGLKVFTSDFLKRRGYCCKSGCQNCPYDELEKGNPNVPFELIESSHDDSPSYEQYEDIEKELFKTEESF